MSIQWRKEYKISKRDVWREQFCETIKVIVEENDNSTTVEYYNDYVHEDILCLTDGFDQYFNPYVNPPLKEYLEKQISVSNENFDKILLVFNTYFKVYWNVGKSIWERWIF